MKDKAGTDIVVGCRVTEADFGFGDGIVESISVPCRGTSLNVGIKWDEPSKGGPSWSAEGGGRGAQHLLVIEAAPDSEPAVGAIEMLPKAELFRRRFNRSPTASEAELSEAEWPEIEEEEEEAEEDDTGGGGGERDGGGGATGGGGVEEEAGVDFDAVVKTDARIKIFMGFGQPGAGWFGALVGKQCNDGAFELGFDDGECRRVSRAELHLSFKNKLLAAATAEEGGVIQNETGHSTASEFVTYRGKTIGLLVGNEGSLAGMAFHMEFHLAEGAFPPLKRVRRKSTERSQQDRDGLHGFLRGNIVEYLGLKTGEPQTRADVFGCINAPPVEGDSQARKMLILYDREAGIFYLGMWPSWRRIRKPSAPIEFDCDNNDHVLSISVEECQKMLDDWKQSIWPASMSSRRKAVDAASDPPPTLKALRDQAHAKAERERKAAEKARREREQERERKRERRKPDPLPPREDPAPPRDPPPRDPPPPRDASPPPRGHYQQQLSPSPPGSVRALKKLIRGLKMAQSVPGQEAAALAARAQQIDGYECDLEERERKYRKYGRWCH